MASKWKVGLALAVPIALLVRSLVKLAEVEGEHARAERRFEDALEKSRERQANAAPEGRSRNTVQCMSWAISRCDMDPGNACDVCLDDLRGCLSTCTRDDEFCTTVPGYTAATSQESEEWRRAQRTGMKSKDWTCAAMFKFVQLHCHPL